MKSSLAVLLALACGVCIAGSWTDSGGHVFKGNVEVEGVLTIQKVPVPFTVGVVTNSGAIYDAGTWGTLEAAISALNGTNCTLLVTTNIPVTADVAVPGYISVKVSQPGKFTVSPGKTLTINGPFEAQSYKIFYFDPDQTSPKIVLYWATDWRTSWFLGAGYGTDPAYHVKAFQIMEDNIGNGTIIVDGNYTFSSPVTINSIINIKGDGKNGKASLGIANGYNGSMFISGNANVVRVNISDLAFFGNRANNLTGGRAIDISSYLQNCEIERCWFLEWRDTGLFADSAGAFSLRDCDFHFCGTGVNINSGNGITIDGCNIENCATNGIVLANVRAFKCQGGQYFGEANKNFIYLTNCISGSINECYFNDWGDWEINMAACKGLSIQRNFFADPNTPRYHWDTNSADITAAHNYDYLGNLIEQ